MKKLFAPLLCFLWGLPVLAQTFVPPFYSETTYPTAAMGLVFRPQHNSCYSMGGAPLDNVSNNLYLHSWNCAGVTGYNGIAWSRNDLTNTTIYDFGYIMKAGAIYDMEVGLISTTSQTYVIASYWTNTGCYYDIYKWDPTGLFPSSLNNLISSTGRNIRMDSHKSYGVALTWEDTDGIRVKVFNTGVVNTLQIGSDRLILNTANCRNPDIAFAHAGTSDLLVRVVYVNPSGNVYVVNKSFNTVLGTTFPSIMFNTDDVQNGINPDELDIDCPDHHGEDNWSYIFRQGNVMKARLKTVSASATPFTITLGDASLSTAGNFAPTLAYANDGLSIYYGWYTAFVANPFPGYIAVERGQNGSYITSPGSYNRVANTSEFGGPQLAFSKQNDQSPSLFAAYAMSLGSPGYEIRSKLVPWTATSFRPGNTTGVENVAQQDIFVSATPSPFHQEFSINIPKDNNLSIYSIAIIDLSGRIVRKLNGNLSTINAGLKGIGSEMLPGIYIVDIHAKGVNKTIKVIKG
ncbi:MAG: T9SS type A sorting domain-containing protein [Taibaiella sp.]|jgi:hypothetical protein